MFPVSETNVSQAEFRLTRQADPALDPGSSVDLEDYFALCQTDGDLRLVTRPFLECK